MAVDEEEAADTAAPGRLVVTVSRGAGEAQRARAEQVAARCSAALSLRRAGLDALFEEFSLVYVVSRRREEIVAASGQRTFVHQALVRSKLREGRRHPLIRAVWPATEHGEGPPARVLDTTLGLCADALHIAGALEVPVVGLESSPVVFSLAEEGLARMREDKRPEIRTAAARITPVHIDHRAFVGQVARGEAEGFDVVVTDPMFERPTHAGPGFDVFRQIADGRPLTAEVLQRLKQLARRRVVMKVRHSQRSLPEGLFWHRREVGTQADLAVHDLAVHDQAVHDQAVHDQAVHDKAARDPRP